MTVTENRWAKYNRRQTVAACALFAALVCLACLWRNAQPDVDVQVDNDGVYMSLTTDTLDLEFDNRRGAKYYHNR